MNGESVSLSVVHKCAYIMYDQKILIPIIFWGILALLNLEFWPYFKYSNEQFVIATPLQPLHGILCNFVFIEDTRCKCAYYEKIPIPLFYWEFFGPFELKILAIS